jgi:hypothetical protein
MVVIQLTMAFVLLAPFLIDGRMMAQAQIITVPMTENGTKLIFNMKDRTQTLVNATTNETISVSKFIYLKGNQTANETLAANTANMTSANTANMTSANTANMTSNGNLAERLKGLSKSN